MLATSDKVTDNQRKESEIVLEIGQCWLHSPSRIGEERVFAI